MYEVDIQQDAEGFTGGDNSHVEQVTEQPAKDNNTLIICITVIVAIAILTVGAVYAYSHKQKAHVQSAANSECWKRQQKSDFGNEEPQSDDTEEGTF